jgi:hypothetical protein
MRDVNAATTGSLSLTGNFSTTGALAITRVNATNALPFNQNGYSITAKSLDFGCDNATGTFNGNFRGTITVTDSVNGTVHNTGTTNIYDTAAWSVGKDWYWQSTHNHYPASGQSLTMTGAGKYVSALGAGALGYRPKKVTFNPGTGNRDSIIGPYDIDTMKQSSGILKFGGNSGTADYAKFDGDSTINRMALCTLTIGDSLIFASPTTITDSLVVKTAGILNLKNNVTQTIKRLLHSAAGALTRFCGTGAITVSNGPTQGDIASVAAGTVTLGGPWKLDSITIAAGTLGTTDHNGADSVGQVTITGGAWSLPNDTTVLTGDWLQTTAGDVVQNAASLLKATKDGARLAFPGDTAPSTIFLNNGYLDSGYSLTRLTLTDGKTYTWQAGKTFAVINLAAADWTGSSPTRTAFRSNSTGTQYTIGLPNAATLEWMNPQDCKLTGYSITVSDGTSLDGGNNTGWIFPVTASTGENLLQRRYMRWGGSWMEFNRRHMRGR